MGECDDNRGRQVAMGNTLVPYLDRHDDGGNTRVGVGRGGREQGGEGRVQTKNNIEMENSCVPRFSQVRRERYGRRSFVLHAQLDDSPREIGVCEVQHRHDDRVRPGDHVPCSIEAEQ